MKNYLQFKKQMIAFGQVEETLKAVEKIAASNIHLLRERVKNFNNYTYQLQTVLAQLLRFSPARRHPLLRQRNKGKKALLLLGGHKGLVGSLYHNLSNLCLAKRSDYQVFLVVGDRLNRYLQEDAVETTPLILDSQEFPDDEEIRKLTAFLFSQFTKGVWRQIDLLYPKFISLVRQEAVIIPFLPFKFELDRESFRSLGFPLFEPGKDEVFAFLLEKYVQLFFYQIMLETKLSEASARTVTAEHAAVKIKQLIVRLKLKFVKTRRRTITQKQLETLRDLLK